AVVGIIECGDGLFAGVGTGNFDGVLHGLSARVQQHGASLTRDGDDFIELLGQFSVGLVRGDHKAGVGEVFDLCFDGLDNFRMRGTNCGDGDSGAQIDQAVAINVFNNATFGT